MFNLFQAISSKLAVLATVVALTFSAASHPVKPVFHPTPGPIVSSSPSAENQVSSDFKCHSQNGLSDSNCTPGVVDPTVTQDNIQFSICVSGYTKKVRPSVSYTDKLKVAQIREYGYSDTNTRDYEEDHLIPLELGGSPTDPKNLWPELGGSPNAKDKIENLCHQEVCNGKITLSEAQKEIASDWHTACQSNPTIDQAQQSIAPQTQVNSNFVPTPVVSNQQATQDCEGHTALCNDGTCSDAAHHQGACSKHGGVAVFYK